MENLNNSNGISSNKAPNPYVSAGILQRLTFTWVFPLFFKGFKHGLLESDMYNHLTDHDSKLLGEQLEKEWGREVKTSKNPSLWKAYRKVFGKDMLFCGLRTLLFELVRLTLPVTLMKLLEYFEPHSTMSKKTALILAGLIAITTLIQITLIHTGLFYTYHLGMRMRVASVALVYRKAVKLSKSALAATSIGQMVNLISNDVSRFETSITNANNIWIAPVQLFILCVLLIRYTGWTSLIGLLALVSVIPFQIWMGKKTSVYRLRTALKTDERIGLMNEIVTGIQVIKMYTWEKLFSKAIQEIEQIKRNSIIKALYVTFSIFFTKVLIYVGILSYYLMGNQINAEYVFGLSLFYELMRQCVSQGVAEGISQVAEAIISTRRIKQFLLYDELIKHKEEIQSSQTKICLDGVSAKWSKNEDVQDISFKASTGELVAVIGKVGSGKSTLFHVILKELPGSGHIQISGTISYASQEPWLFVGTIRQNIVFSQPFDENKYRKIIKICALEQDFMNFPFGDRSNIGERGTSLSGGQKARINLARAIYKDADIYLLDDPLSAVDAKVGKQIFDECIINYLKDKCVVLISHQLQYLQRCKRIYLLKDGEVKCSGTYEDIQRDGREFTNLLEELKSSENAEDNITVDRQLNITVDKGKLDEQPNTFKESKIEGKVTWKMYKSYFLSGGSLCNLIILIGIFLTSQVFVSSIDYFLGYWVDYEMKVNFLKTISLTSKSCLYIYTGLILFTFPLIITRGLLLFKSCIKASINLHNNILIHIIHAPIRFFYLNPTGRILNRFSKDLNMVDEYLPITLSDTVQYGLTMLANVIVISIVIPIMLGPTVILLMIFYVIRMVFISSSRDIKRFEAITRSPMYSHLTATLQGLTTIRAFNSQDLLIQEFDYLQNQYNSAYFMFLSANRCFGYWLDLNTTIFVTLVTFSFLILNTGVLGGSVGLAITQAINLAGLFQYCIRQWSEMETTMTCVERIKEYTEIQQETTKNSKEPPENWPENGHINFVNVSLRYATEEPYVLKNLNIEIEPEAKIGIVGRTGAGKSSIINALFRLAEIDGNVYVNCVDIKLLPLPRLRSSLSIIPQEPVLFSGTLRKNLDPAESFSDEVLWNALEDVGLKSIITALAAGLECHISEGGSNFSTGQRQLVCLARAIVRNNKILLLDEATAHIDPHSDALIQRVIREKFSRCTVLTIAHRLHTVMDSDKILVMNDGMLMEFDEPHVLLQNPNSALSAIVRETGESMAVNLRNIAAEVAKTKN